MMFLFYSYCEQRITGIGNDMLCRLTFYGREIWPEKIVFFSWVDMMLGHSVIHVSARILTCLVFLGTQQVKRYVQGGQGTFFEATEFEGGFVAFFIAFLC